MTLCRVTATLRDTYSSQHRVHLDAMLGAAVAMRMDLPPIDRDTPADELIRMDLPVERVDLGAHGIHLASATLDPVGDVGALHWLAWGDRRGIRDRIRLIHHVDREGDRRSAPVESWDIEPIDGHPAATLLRDGLTVRHLPASWCDADETEVGAHEPPYWHPGRRTEIVPVGVSCALSRDVIRALDQLHGESRSAHRPRVADPRRDRTVTATDAEWDEIRRRARDADMTISQFVRDRCL